MPISFACECGKQFKVADEYAGKRTKCPGCMAMLTVPAAEAPTPAPTEPDEDAAFRALTEGPEPPPRRTEYEAPPPPPRSESPRPAPRPTPPPPKPKPKPRQPAHDPYAPPQKSWNVDGGKVGGGIIAIVLGTALLVGGLAFGRLFIWSPIIIIGGIISVIGGLLNRD